MKNSFSKLRKHLIILPSNFQELVILKEMKFDSGDRSIELVRELLYLYSLGMEYYDSINNTLLYSHYSNRNIKMLLNPEVISALDKSKSRKSKDLPSLEILNDSPYKTVDEPKNNINIYKQNTMYTSRDSSLTNPFSQLEYEYNNFLTIDDKDSSMISSDFKNRSYTTLNKNKKEFFEVCKKEAKSEVNNLEYKLNKIEDLMSEDLNSQMDLFEERKQKKKERLRIKPRKSMRYMIRKGSKLDEILIAVIAQGACSNSDKIDESDILKGILELSEKKAKSLELIMMREIDDYVEKNIAEMNKSLDELRISFEDEIKSVDEDVFPDVARGLKEDMDVELENLRDQYEEQRRDGIEKIKAKYNRKN